MNRNPVGFSGGGLWALILLLVIGVGWVESRFGITVAGYAVIAVFGGIFLIVGALLILAALQSFGNLLVGMKQAESKVKIHEARAMASMVNNEGRIMATLMRMVHKVGGMYGKSYQAQIDAEYAQKLATQAQPQDNPYIDLSATQDEYKYADEEW